MYEKSSSERPKISDKSNYKHFLISNFKSFFVHVTEIREIFSFSKNLQRRSVLLDLIYTVVKIYDVRHYQRSPDNQGVFVAVESTTKLLICNFICGHRSTLSGKQ